MSYRSTTRKQLKYNIAFLKIIGLYTEKSDFFETRHYWKYTILVTVFFMGLFNLSQLVNLFVIWENLELLASCAYSALICSMASVKAYFFVKKWPLLSSLNQMLEMDYFQPRNDKQKIRAEATIRVYLVVYFALTLIVIPLYLLWVINPLVNDPEKIRLPYLAWYPFDWKRSTIVYVATYLHQTIGLFYICFTNANLDLMTSSYMVFVAVECDILADIIRNLYDFTALSLKADPKSLLRKQEVLNAMESTLIDCICYYKKILKFSEGVGQLFNIGIFIQLAASLISICMTLFQLTVLSPTSPDFMAVFLYQLALLLQLLLYNWFGNEVILKSTGISNALYESHWIDSSVVYKRRLHFFMLRTQKPIQIYAIDFFVLSVGTFTYILRASWSAFAVLRQVNNK